MVRAQQDSVCSPCFGAGSTPIAIMLDRLPAAAALSASVLFHGELKVVRLDIWHLLVLRRMFSPAPRFVEPTTTAGTP